MRIGIGGPVGSGKTMLVLRLCQWLRGELSIAVVTNDIYTREDAEFLVRQEALPADRVIGVETGGCPHTAIRDDTSMNLAAIAELEKRHPDVQVILVESGGDNLSATFSPACGSTRVSKREIVPSVRSSAMASGCAPALDAQRAR